MYTCPEPLYVLYARATITGTPVSSVSLRVILPVPGTSLSSVRYQYPYPELQ